MPSVLSVNASSTESFDYSSLDADTSWFVREQTEEIKALMKQTAEGIVKIGQKLIEVKKRLGYGHYRQWIEAEFHWGKSTANSFENVAKRFADVQNLDNFAPSALYELAAPSTSESAKEEALTRADSGEFITFTTAKEIKQKFAAPTTPKHTKTEPEKQSSLDLTDNEVRQSVKEPLASDTSTREPAPSEQSQTKQIELIQPEISSESKVVQPESWWQLGRHLLYCGDTHSPQFLNRLPQQIALAIAFPQTADWHLKTLATKVKSALTVFSSYQDLDLNILRKMVENSLELYTNGGETVLFSFLLDPALLLLVDRLDCNCAIAEPNPLRCEAVIHAWTQTGGKAFISDQ
ncbi:MAG: DUF3102 domain-containing protein [Hydrococcus sp. Prado102]|jgi:hypothetical protein|nr:DUF3102 domain-containing protein [Hydrococcus sp. Prado102]